MVSAPASSRATVCSLPMRHWWSEQFGDPVPVGDVVHDRESSRDPPAESRTGDQ